MTAKTPLQTIGSGLNRPECVITHISGLLFTADWTGNGGVTIIQPRGCCHKVLNQSTSQKIRPNGIVLEAGGTFLIAHLGDHDGGIFRLNAKGEILPVVLTANGHPLPPTNFVTKDELGRIWITVSTRVQPRDKDYRSSACTGFIAVAEPGCNDARIVADKLGYTNECAVDLQRGQLAVNETFKQQTTVFDLKDDASLQQPRIIAHYTAGTFPDGLALDSQGNYWITSIISNRIIKVSPDGQQTLMFEDADRQFVDRAHEAYTGNALNKKHLNSAGNTHCRNLTCLAFSGTNTTSAYLGNLLDDKLYLFETDVCGADLPHHTVDLGPLAQYL